MESDLMKTPTRELKQQYQDGDSAEKYTTALVISLKNKDQSTTFLKWISKACTYATNPDRLFNLGMVLQEFLKNNNPEEFPQRSFQLLETTVSSLRKEIDQQFLSQFLFRDDLVQLLPIFYRYYAVRQENQVQETFQGLPQSNISLSRIPTEQRAHFKILQIIESIVFAGEPPSKPLNSIQLKDHSISLRMKVLDILTPSLYSWESIGTDQCSSWLVNQTRTLLQEIWSDSEVLAALSRDNRRKVILFSHHVYSRLGRPDWMINFYPGIYRHYKLFVENEDIALAMDAFSFIDFLFHAQNPVEKNKEFAQNEQRVHQRFLRNRIQSDTELKPVDRASEAPFNVGYFLYQLTDFAPFRICFSLLKGHQEKDSRNFQFFLYNTGEYTAKSQELEQEFEQALPEITIRDLPEQMDSFSNRYEWAKYLRKRVIADEIDVAVYCRDQICGFLSQSRTAPVQIFFTYGNAYFGYDGIDGYQSYHQHRKEWEKHRNVNLISYPILDRFVDPDVDQKQINDLKERFSSFSGLFGTFCRLSKMNEERFVDTVAKILKENPETAYIYAGTGDPKTIQQKFQKEGVHERTFYEGFVDAHVYGHVIDVYLSQFPNIGGLSEIEAMAKGVPVVTMSFEQSTDKKLQKYPRTESIQHTYGIGDLHVNDGDTKKYLQNATDLIQNQNFYDQMSRKANKKYEEKYNLRKTTRRVEEFYRECIQSSWHE